MPITLASSVARTSSSKDWRACEISGLMEASVRERKSVPQRCFTSFGRSECTSSIQVRTIVGLIIHL